MLSQISLARCLKPSYFGIADVKELHHFADASRMVQSRTQDLIMKKGCSPMQFPRWKVPFG